MLEEVSKIYLEDKTQKKCQSHRHGNFCSCETFYSRPEISNANKLHAFAVVKKNYTYGFPSFSNF